LAAAPYGLFDNNKETATTMAEFAFVFPGQGSQSVGMLDAWGDHPAVRDTLAEASSAGRSAAGDRVAGDLARMIAQGPKEVLDLTVNTQIVMLVAAVACYRAWRAEGGAEPAAAAGHSLGEYSALVAAEVLSLTDAVPLVRQRAMAMQDAVPPGAGGMVAVLGLDGALVARICAQAQADSAGQVSAANFNDPRQTVISGDSAALQMASAALQAAGAKRLLPLAVSAPFHSPLMLPAAEKLKTHLAGVVLREPRFPVINNVDVTVETTPERIRDALVRQAYMPVRWVEVMQALRGRGLQHVIECGPGKVLSKIVVRTYPELKTAALLDPASLRQVREMLA
jgi:[acyl-carrier-protein] S-malonyltransferase